MKIYQCKKTGSQNQQPVLSNEESSMYKDILFNLLISKKEFA